MIEISFFVSIGQEVSDNKSKTLVGVKQFLIFKKKVRLKLKKISKIPFSEHLIFAYT